MDTHSKSRKSPIKPFLTGLALGTLVGGLAMYLQQPKGESAQPVQRAHASADCGAGGQKPAMAAPTIPKDFEFYGVLEKAPVTPVRPDLEHPPVPPPLAPSPPSASPDAARPIYLQVASFKSEADANALKARVVLTGIQATVVAMDIPDKGTHYRVRIGPFANPAALARAKAQLSQGGIELGNAFVVR